MANEVPADLFFSAQQPSAASVPNLITLFDSELLNALVGINGAKPGVWHAAPPYDENDRYQPFRDDVPFAAWSLAYNQAELLALTGYSNTLVYGNDTLIVDSTADEKALLAAEASKAENSYLLLPDFPTLLKK